MLALLSVTIDQIQEIATPSGASSSILSTEVTN